MRLTILTILCGLSFYSYGQNCTQRLNQAEDDYEAGRLLGIPGQLENCLVTDQFSKEEEVRARKLLALVYIFTDQEARAEQAMISLLKADPEHRLDPQVDPAELFFLYEQFRTAPIFRISFKAGVNSSSVVLIEDYATHDVAVHHNFYNGKTPDGADSYRSPSDSVDYDALSGLGIGYWGEIMFHKEVYEGLEVGFGGQFRNSVYNTDSYIQQRDLNVSVMNSQTNLRAPLLVTYTLWAHNRDKRILPYGFLGGSFDYLLSATSEGTRAGGTAYSLPSSDLISTGQVNRLNYSLTGGAGVKFRMKTHFITAELRYDSSRRNFINGEDRYTNSSYAFDLGYVDPAISLDFLSVSIGYTWSIYKPKKY